MNPPPLKFSKEIFNNDGAHPTVIKHYDEIYNGLKSVNYPITHSGNWDYLKYIRTKDSKEFNFTIDHASNPYGKSSCF